MTKDFAAIYAEIRAGIEESLRFRSAQLKHPEFFVGGRQNGKSQPRIRGQQDVYAIYDETHLWRQPDLSAVEAVAAKYATEPKHRFAGIVHRAEHYGVDYRGDR